MKLSSAMKEAFIGKYKSLNVINHGSFYSYNPLADEGYQVYCCARNILSKHKIIERILKWIKII